MDKVVMSPVVNMAGADVVFRPIVNGSPSTNPDDLRISTGELLSVQKTVTYKSKEVESGKSDAPVMEIPTGEVTKLDMTFSTIDHNTLAFLQGYMQMKVEGGEVADRKAMTVPSSGKIVLKQTVTEVVVETEAHERLKKGAGAAVSGEDDYVIGEDKKSIVFAEKHKGKTVVVYLVMTDNYNMTRSPKTPIRPVVLVELFYDSLSKDKDKRYRNHTTIYRMVLDGDISESMSKNPENIKISMRSLTPPGCTNWDTRSREIELNEC